MDRKKTILIAVMINAGLLALLFIMGLYQEEEVPKNVDLSQLLPQESKPLFNEVQEVQTPLLAQQQPIAPAEPSSVTVETVHQLPPLVKQEHPVIPPPAAAPIAPICQTVTVKKGDTLEKIARAHHTTVSELLRVNQLPNNFLRIGQVLKMPSEKHLGSKQKSQPVEKKSSETEQIEYYIVKVGDNPWTIAMKHHMKVDELLRINNLNEEKARRLKPGDKLKIR